MKRLTILGAHPPFIKSATVSRAIRAPSRFSPLAPSQPNWFNGELSRLPESANRDAKPDAQRRQAPRTSQPRRMPQTDRVGR